MTLTVYIPGKWDRGQKRITFLMSLSKQKTEQGLRAKANSQILELQKNGTQYIEEYM